ncbi:hypothetical protein OPT61_g4294 [Boeremia exigua]|uniref:Uncharacterized protein n=1 Tax=Boeremia exigua TaxID=749465 RepID=A0ACC2IEM4_9PLEO|nr:hypothetical protein OPT61_g4294 [Boeremia exigua]
MSMLCQVREYQWSGMENDAGRQARMGGVEATPAANLHPSSPSGDSLLLVWGAGAGGPAQQIWVTYK